MVMNIIETVIIILYSIVMLLALILLFVYINLFIVNIPPVSFPFKNFYTDDGVCLPIIAITAPFRSKSDLDLYHTLKHKGVVFIGMTSYMEFPLSISNPHDPGYTYSGLEDIDASFYLDVCQAWLTCFKEPLPVKTPQIQISHSDFTVDRHVDIPDKQYDFLYVCLPDKNSCQGWQSQNRNWEFAKECIEYMTTQKGLTGLLVGRKQCVHQLSHDCQEKVHATDFLPFHEFQRMMALCRWTFVPNRTDASPRVVTESFMMNMPVFMNAHILGGWRYMDSKHTGRTFIDMDDFKKQLNVFLESKYSPKYFFTKYYGKENTGKRLYDFLKVHNLLKHVSCNYVYPDV